MKNKVLSSFVCQECGYDSPQWLGKCPECGVWNSLKEFQTSSKLRTDSGSLTRMTSRAGMTSREPKTLSQVTSKEGVQNDIAKRITTGFSEMDAVLGGGIVKGSVILLAGDPGIGKSTLLLQTGLNVALAGTESLRSPRQFENSSDASHVPYGNVASAPASRISAGLGVRPAKAGSSEEFSHAKAPRDSKEKANDQSRSTEGQVLYISGEESEEQIGLRAKRIVKVFSSNFLLISITDTDAIYEAVEKIKPSIVIIDSIQAIESESLGGLSGSVGQVRYATSRFVRLAKTLNIPFLIVGHVTKEGMVAGPMVLSHMVDVVLFLEGEKTTGTRVLRSFKNRFGPIDEVGIFTMEGQGLKELKNPQALFLSKYEKEIPGSSLGVTMEGTRVFLVEIQALVVFSKLPIPRRVASGFDQRRLELLLAILQKHAKIPIAAMDIFVNVAGGIKVSDPALDLSVCLSLYSSFKNIPISKTVGIGEVGLLGEVRTVPFMEKRIKEAQKLGFKKTITAKDYKYLSGVVKSIS